MRPDNEIAVSVANMLKWHIAVDDGKIKVTVEQGVVTLEGFVDWESQRQTIEEMIRNVPGVLRLDNLIDIKKRATAETIRVAVVAALQKHPDAKAIKVQVVENKVVLRGSVRDYEARESAERLAWHNYGVLEVDNQLLIAVPEYLY